jgi:hypothetical protein
MLERSDSNPVEHAKRLFQRLWSKRLCGMLERSDSNPVQHAKRLFQRLLEHNSTNAP